MREIRFRAWDYRTRTMKYPVPYDDENGKCPDELKGKFCPSELQDKNGHRSHISDVLMNENLYEPMQYIVTEDNQDIYEKDIIEEWKHGILLRTFIAEDIRTFTREYDKSEHDSIWKVIGNKFENPELLNETPEENRI